RRGPAARPPGRSPGASSPRRRPGRGGAPVPGHPDRRPALAGGAGRARAAAGDSGGRRPAGCLRTRRVYGTAMNDPESTLPPFELPEDPPERVLFLIRLLAL